MQKVTIDQRRAPVMSGEQAGLVPGFAVLPQPPAASPLVHTAQADADAEQSFFDELYLLAPVGYCVLGLDTCSDEAPCALHDVWKLFRENYADTLSRMTLDDAAHILRAKRARRSGVRIVHSV